MRNESSNDYYWCSLSIHSITFLIICKLQTSWFTFFLNVFDLVWDLILYQAFCYYNTICLFSLQTVSILSFYITYSLEMSWANNPLRSMLSISELPYAGASGHVCLAQKKLLCRKCSSLFPRLETKHFLCCIYCDLCSALEWSGLLSSIFIVFLAV